MQEDLTPGFAQAVNDLRNAATTADWAAGRTAMESICRVSAISTTLGILNGALLELVRMLLPRCLGERSRGCSISREGREAGIAHRRLCSPNEE